MDVVGIVVDAVTVGAIVVLGFRFRRGLLQLSERQQSTQTQWKQGYETTNRRISEHIQSRMHGDY